MINTITFCLLILISINFNANKFIIIWCLVFMSFYLSNLF